MKKKEEVDIVMIMTLFFDLSHIYQSMDKKNHHHSNFEICGLNILVHKNSNDPSRAEAHLNDVRLNDNFCFLFH